MHDKQRIIMVRDNLEHIPQYPLPAPYSYRWYQPGDESNWVAINAPLYWAGMITVGLFREQFGTDAAPLQDRQCFLLDGQGVPIGTATAWFNDHFSDPGYGRIHWVAIAGEHQGRGLSKALMTIVLRRLPELGYSKAYLTAYDDRTVAIHLYEKFGFVIV